MNKIIYILFISFLLSCQTQTTEDNTVKEKSIIENKNDTLTNRTPLELKPIEEIEGFDIETFKRNADTFLIKFTGIKNEYYLTIDTINESINRKILYDTNLLKYLVINSKTLIHYSFDDKKSKENLDFRIIEIQFLNTDQCTKVFNKLSLYADTKAAIDNFKYTPCLTYQNDRLLKGKKKIYWLDNSCTFSFKTHRDYLKILRNTLINFQPNDSIICKCGSVTSIK